MKDHTTKLHPSICLAPNELFFFPYVTSLCIFRISFQEKDLSTPNCTHQLVDILNNQQATDYMYASIIYRGKNTEEI